jgi:hypothetical protein
LDIAKTLKYCFMSLYVRARMVSSHFAPTDATLNSVWRQAP